MLNVVWATGTPHQQDWEYDWIAELFAGIPTVWHTDIHKCSPMPNAVIVFNIKSVIDGEHMTRYIKQYDDANEPYALIHLSDEYYAMFDYRLYFGTNCKAVYRNYWHPQLNAPHIHTFALGYKRGFWDGADRSRASEQARPFVWTFAGNIRHRQVERIHAIACFADVLPHKVVEETSEVFGEQVTGLSTHAYRDLLLQTKFALCPVGHINLDTFRLYEALEAGCIPVATKKTQFQNWTPSYWVQLFGVKDENDLPFVLGDTWQDCKLQVANLVCDEAAYKTMQMKALTFWLQYKSKLKATIHRNLMSLCTDGGEGKVTKGSIGKDL